MRSSYEKPLVGGEAALEWLGFTKTVAPSLADSHAILVTPAYAEFLVLIVDCGSRHSH